MLGSMCLGICKLDRGTVRERSGCVRASGGFTKQLSGGRVQWMLLASNYLLVTSVNSDKQVVVNF